jgi:DtxR family Mn-dependent transcriptional regulator
MHFTSDEVHEIAEELEHVNSPVFFRRIKEMLSQIQKDPHGSSIPEIDF